MDWELVSSSGSLLLTMALCISAARVAAQPADEPADDSLAAVAELEGVTIETLASGLTAPISLAVPPASTSSGPDVFIADRGAGKIVAADSDEGGELVDVVTGFAAADDDTSGTLLGLMFLNRSTLLAVTEGANRDEQLVAHFSVKDEEWPLEANAAATTSKLALPDEREPPDGFRSAGMAQNIADVFVTSPSGLVFRAAVTGSELKAFSRFNDVAESTGAVGLSAITFSEKGYLVAALAGGTEQAGDSRIAFCHPYEKDAEPLLVVDPGLDDIVALAYSPETGNLYAADFSEQNPSEGGVYRIDAHRDEETKKMGAKAVLVAKVAGPTALAFAGDGSLLVAASEAGSERKGVVLKLSGEL